MGMNRAQMEKELGELLNKALQLIPFIRLDKVDEVTEKFRLACEFLEAELEGDVHLSAEEDEGREDNHIPRSVPNDAGDDSDSDGDGGEEQNEEEQEKEKERERERERELEREREQKRSEAPLTRSGSAAKLGGAKPTTRDFDSPDIKGRSLGKGGGGGGGGEASRAPPPARAGAGMSSRARGAIPAPSGDTRLGLKGTGAAKKSHPGLLREALTRPRDKDDNVQISARFTKDEGTPKLGGRSLLAAASGSTKQNDLVRENADTSGSDDERRSPDERKGGEGGDLMKPSSLASSEFNSEPSSPPHDADLTTNKIFVHESRPHPSAAVSRLQEADVTHSPLQINAHRTLLTLAGRPAAGTPLATSTSVAKSLTSPKGGSDAVLVTDIAPKALTTESPKPGFLRRLDSPMTSHGRLLQHKTHLNKMVRRAQRGIPHIKAASMEMVKEKFALALDLLEGSTTLALAKSQPSLVSKVINK